MLPSGFATMLYNLPLQLNKICWIHSNPACFGCWTTHTTCFQGETGTMDLTQHAYHCMSSENVDRERKLNDSWTHRTTTALCAKLSADRLGAGAPETNEIPFNGDSKVLLICQTLRWYLAWLQNRGHFPPATVSFFPPRKATRHRVRKHTIPSRRSAGTSNGRASAKRWGVKLSNRQEAVPERATFTLIVHHCTPISCFVLFI